MSSPGEDGGGVFQAEEIADVDRGRWEKAWMFWNILMV